MAGNWIKFDTSTSDKPEVWAIAEKLGIDPDAVVGKLLRVWAWFDDQTENGEAASGSIALLDRRVGVDGFCEAMCEVGWLSQNGSSVSVANFDRHNGQTAKKRANTAKRVANHKAGIGNASGNATGNASGNALRVTTRQIIPRPVRKSVYDRDGHACAYCGRKEGETDPREPKIAGSLAIDHVIPLARGGENIEKNMVTSCVACNQYKSDRTPDECGLNWPMVNGERLGVTKSVTKSVSESVTGALPKEEKRREEKNDTHTHTSETDSPPIDADLAPHWNRWCEYVLAISGQPVNAIQADALLMELGRRGTAKAIRDIDFSIRKSAKSILDSDNDFEKRQPNGHPTKKARNYT